MPSRTCLFFAFSLIPLSLSADPLTWDGDTTSSGLQDGAGTWNTTAMDRWFNSGTIPPDYQIWSNATPDIAIFGVGSGTADTITLEEAITAGGLTFNAAGSGNYTLTGNVLTLAGTPIVTTNADATIISSLAGIAGMSKTGVGNLILSGSVANTLTGTTLISGGTLTMNKNTGVTAIAGDIEVATGGTLAWASSRNNQVADTAAILVSGGTVVMNSRSDTFASYTQTSGGLTGSSNAGIITITGALTLSGGSGITINSNGSWSAQTVDFTGASTGGNVVLLGGDGKNFVTRFSIGSGGLTLTGQAITLNRTSGAGNLGNEMVLNGDITSSGTSRILTNASGVLPDGAINQLTLDQTRRWNVLSDTSTLSLPMAGGGGLDKIGDGILVLSGGVSSTNTGVVTVTAGTLSLGKTAGVDAVGGNIEVNGGTLSWAAADQIPDTATITVTSGPTLSFGGRNETFANYIQTGGTGISASSANSGIVNITGTATLSSGGAMTVNSGGRMFVNEIISNGSGRTILNIGGNSAARISSLTIGSGGLSMTGQTITLNKATTDGNQGCEIILNGNITATGTNNINLSSGTFGVAQVNLGAAERTFAINSGTTTFNVPIVGTGGIIKTGAGTLRLTTPNTYSGKTTLSEGHLLLTPTGDISESTWIQIDSSATLDVSSLSGGFIYVPTTGTPVISGSGSITGGLNLGGIAQIRPGSTSDPAAIATAGDGYGTLAISGDLIFNPSAPSTVASLQILDASSADKITSGGALTLTANSHIAVTFDPGYLPVSGDSWELLDWVGLLNAIGFSSGDNNRTGNDLAGNEGNLDLPDLTPWGLLWDIGTLENGGNLTISLVPEPGRLVCLSLGLLLVSFRRRR